jgi:DNA polymerase elongation subunit (family B)
MKVNKPLSILVFDIETSPVELLKFQKDRNPFISSDGISKDSYMISACWKSLGDKHMSYAASVKPWDDYSTVKKLRDALSRADVIIGHNSDKFDIKYLNARLIFHNLPPLPQVASVDTLKEIKKVASFTSHKLDYLSHILCGERKNHVSFELWKQVVSGDRLALNKMVAYNKKDVLLTEKLYKRLLPYMKSHPHVGAMLGKDRRLSCNKCGSTDIKRNGIRITAAGMKKQEIQCMSCFGYSRIPLVNISL